VVAHEDITHQKLAELHLHIVELQQRAMLDTLPDLFWLKDSDGRYQVVNHAFCQFHGLLREDIVGKTAEELFAPEIVAGIRAGDRAIIEHGGISRDVIRTFDSGIASGWVETTKGLAYDEHGVILGIVGMTRDITKRKQAEEERIKIEQRLQNVQRLESLGVLAGGMAHDFNNLLAGILGYAELALQDLPSTSNARADIEAVIRGAHEAAELTNQMLAYSGKGHFVIQPVDLNKLIQETHELLEASIAETCLVRYDLAHQLLPIDADHGQMRQVIVNLLINAAEAIGTADGTITLITAQESLSRESLDGLMFGADLALGLYVRLTVADTGAGMDEATLARIFDPFFTTKFTGRGLGLAALQGIVRGHRGALRVTSAPGEGTVFSIWFPGTATPPATTMATDRSAALVAE
jgi:PAS domain S-box-containing protein